MRQIMRKWAELVGLCGTCPNAQLCARSPIMRKIMRAHNRIIQRSLMELIRPQLAARASNPVGLHMSTHCALLTALNDEHTESSSSEPSIHNTETSSTAQRGRCHVCSKEFAGTGDSKKKKSNRANKTRHRCVQCNQWACSKHASVETHTQYFCNKCK